MVVHNIEEASIFHEEIGKPRVTVVDFFATWCGPCKAIAPKIVEFSDTYKDVYFCKVDVDQLPAVAEKMEVSAMPTFKLFKNGEEISKVVGANPRALEELIKKALE